MASLRLLWIGIFLLFAATTAAAEDASRALKIKSAWLDWMAANGITNSTLTVFNGNSIVGTYLEGPDAKPQFPLASLSKAVTGVCVRYLIENGELQGNSSMTSIFGDDLAALGLSSNANGDLTVSELLSQTGGVFPDETQPRMYKWLNSTRDRHERVAKRALARMKQGAESGKFTYNNENYAILGAIVERITGEDYSSYCNDKVLVPLDITSARPSTKYGAFAAWGGWEMTSEDFARFLAGSFGPDTKYGSEPKKWPYVTVAKDVYYGLGTLFRSGKRGQNFWHHGGLCFGLLGNNGSFYAYWFGKLGVVVAYDKCPDNKLMTDLDIALGRAAFR